MIHCIKLLGCVSLLWICSCAPSSTTAKEKNIENVANQQDPTTDTSVKIDSTLSTPLKNELHGIWASLDYYQLLQQTQSVTEAINSIFKYTTIVFDGKESLRCHNPNYVEADHLRLLADSSLIAHNQDNSFRIKRIENDSMWLLYTDGTHVTYTRILDQANLNKLYLDEIKGHDAMELHWLAGNYQIELNGTVQTMELLPTGKVSGIPLFRSFALYSYADLDMIGFDLKNGLSKDYVMEFATDSVITLDEIELIDADDAPVIYTGENGTLKKVKNP